MTDLLRTDEAARLAGITPAAFRKAAANDPALREAKIMLDARTPAYPRAAVEAWRAATPRRIVKGAALVVLAVLALSACGSPDAPSAPQETVPASPVAQVQDAPEATASECYAYYVDGVLTPDAAAWIDRFNGLPSINEDTATAIVIYQDLLDDAPTGPFCTVDDQKIATELSGQLVDSIADAEQTLAG